MGRHRDMKQVGRVCARLCGLELKGNYGEEVRRAFRVLEGNAWNYYNQVQKRMPG